MSSGIAEAIFANIVLSVCLLLVGVVLVYHANKYKDIMAAVWGTFILVLFVLSLILLGVGLSGVLT